MRLVLMPVVAAVAAGCWGAPVAQSEACERYVRCVRAMDAVTGETTNVDRYLDGGGCWKNPSFAEGCDTSCVRALERPAAWGAPSVPECAP